MEDFLYGRFHFGDTTREVDITPSQYILAGLKCFGNRFAKNPIYLCHTLCWIEHVAISNLRGFFERKKFQEDNTAGKIISCTIWNMLSDDIMKALLKNIKGTTSIHVKHEVRRFDKYRNFDVYTFFGTFTPTEAHWLEFLQIKARQFGINLSDEDVQNMSMKERRNGWNETL